MAAFGIILQGKMGLELISRPKASGVTSNIKVADERVQLGRLVQQRHGHVGSGVRDGSGHDRCLNFKCMAHALAMLDCVRFRCQMSLCRLART